MTEVKNNFPEWWEIRASEIGNVMDAVDPDATREFVDMVSTAPAVFVIGGGRSGLVARSFAMRLMQMGVGTHVPGETTCPHIDSGELLIALSCSGETATTVEMATTAIQVGAPVIALVGEKQSTLGREATHSVVLPTGEVDRPSGEAFPVNTLFEESAFVYCDRLVELLMERMDVHPERLVQMHANLE